MNTAVIANHLNIETHMIVRIERWKTVLFVVIRGVRARKSWSCIRTFNAPWCRAGWTRA